MNLEGTIWDEHVFGLTFDGKQVNYDGESFCVSSSTPLILFECPGEDSKEADRFFSERGFNVCGCYIPDEKSDEEIEEYLLSLEYKDAVVIILTKDRQLRRCEKLFKNHCIRYQLFSRIQWFFQLFRPNLKKAYHLLKDDYSKEVFTAVTGVRYKLLPESALRPYYTPNQYFAPPEMCMIDAMEVFVDCGAYVGDVVEKYIQTKNGCFKRIYAFEPGAKQYEALQNRAKRLCAEWALSEDQICCAPYGVGSQSEKMGFAQGGDGLGSMHIAKGEPTEEYAQIVDLDTYLSEEPRIGFIKSDIEGFEMEMLQGAARIIQRDKPLLAITLYHKLTDYYEIPLYLHQLVPEYQFKVLHHYFNWWETVLYAYIE